MSSKKISNGEKHKNKKRKNFENGNEKGKKKKIMNGNEMDEQSVKAFWEENEISVEGNDFDWKEFPPLKKFQDSDLPEDLLQICSTFETTTPIQSQCIPIGLKGRDLIAIAETGSGKTLGYLIPALSHLRENNFPKYPTILVVAPTRELAIQISEVAEQSNNPKKIKSVCVYGGVSKEHQRISLKKGANIVIATPGRLLDLISEGACDISKVSFLVLDEADRMLDMGFEPDIKKIMAALPKTRQTAMFSATWPEDIRALASTYLRNPVKVTIGNDDLSACTRVTQIVEVVEPRQKDWKLEQLLRKYHNKKNRVLVFCLYKKEAARVERNLQKNGWKAAGIHGDMTQQQRTTAFHGFRDGSVPLLVATDVASRGLDIPNVEYVINYTFPLTIEDYIHRIGRTGRANKTGIAHTLFTIEEKAKAGDLCKVLRDANQVVPEELQKFGPSIKKKKPHALYGNHYADTAGEPKQATRITFDESDEE